jgi:superfamily II DNA or RNA helicase
VPRIFDNIKQSLLPALTETLQVAHRADFCIGYFNLRGWQQIADAIEPWPGGEGQCCRLLVGMQRLPDEEMRLARSIVKRKGELDNQTALRLKKQAAEQFRRQLTYGVPTSADEIALRQLAAQIKARKVIVKLFLRHSLHAKLYLLFRHDPINPVIGYLGSSNLTLSGLAYQGELNVDVLDRDASEKLATWFKDRWNDRWCVDISDELVQVIEESWAREELTPPYHIYVKMAYHLAREARAGLTEFRVPSDFSQKILPFQVAAVKIAAHHLNRRSGVLIGDVVGLGKTLMATAVARIFEDDYGLETLIICPRNLVSMWEDYAHQYRLRAKVLSITLVLRELPDLRRYRLVIIDESHNLRNREGRRYRAIREYIRENESRCILLSATPYNKTYLDLSSQLRIFVPEEQDLGIRPEQLLREIGEIEFNLKYQCPIRSLLAFEKSPHPDDWRELMRLYMVRRTRSFIKEHYAATDPETGRRYLAFEDGTRSPFPERKPRTLRFQINDENPDDQYARLYAPDVVQIINALNLPRYGLGNYISSQPKQPPNAAEERQLADLSRAGKRLMGFCRTNLFKRLESSGQVFIQSVERHILRNYVYLHAIEHGKPLPLGTQDVGMLDPRIYDEDADAVSGTLDLETATDREADVEALDEAHALRTGADFERRAAEVYALYETRYRRRFGWLRPTLFTRTLRRHLREDAQALMTILQTCGEWDPARDAKLDALHDLLTQAHPDEKVIVFSQFADTVRYLAAQLEGRGLARLAGVTGDSEDPTALAWRFSPVSNEKREQTPLEDELRVLVATDVLSEGQNLQDCAIVVNYDLPWAIIRLIQRAGRVDRIGQRSGEILCYTFLPAEGVERVLRLRARVRQRLKENAEVVGTDEAFFEDDADDRVVLDLYNEAAGILDDEDTDGEVDLASYAYQIWRNAVEADPRLERVIPALPPVAYATRSWPAMHGQPPGALVYMQTADGNDALAWVDEEGHSVTQSHFTILRAAACAPGTPALPRSEIHHELVERSVELMMDEERSTGGQLGRPSGARFRTYVRLKALAEQIQGTLFEYEYPDLGKVIDQMYHHPLRQAATDTLNRQLRSGISDEELARLAVSLWEDDRLCWVTGEEEGQVQEPRIICSMGLRGGGSDAA